MYFKNPNYQHDTIPTLLNPTVHHTIHPPPSSSTPTPPLFPSRTNLRRRQSLKSLRDLRLPAHLGLAEDLSRRFEVMAAVEEDGAHDDLVAHDGLVVVDVRGAVGAVVAAYCFSCFFLERGR